MLHIGFIEYAIINQSISKTLISFIERLCKDDVLKIISKSNK